MFSIGSAAPRHAADLADLTFGIRAEGFFSAYQNPAITAEFWATRLAQPQAFTVIALDLEGRAIGYADGEVDVIAHLARLAVVTSWRGLTVGASLLLEFEAQARGLGALGVRLESLSNCRKAHALYEAFGYEPVGAISDVCGDFVVFEKKFKF